MSEKIEIPKIPTIEGFEYIDITGKVQKLDVKIGQHKNSIKFQSSFEKYGVEKDLEKFGTELLQEMIISPVELKDINTFINDGEALSSLVGGLLEYQLKKSERKDRKLMKIEIKE